MLTSAKVNEVIRASGNVISPAALASHAPAIPKRSSSKVVLSTTTSHACTMEGDLATLQRLAHGIPCAVSFQLVCSAQGLPLMGVATMLPIGTQLG